MVARGTLSLGRLKARDVRVREGLGRVSSFCDNWKEQAEADPESHPIDMESWTKECRRR